MEMDWHQFLRMGGRCQTDQKTYEMGTKYTVKLLKNISAKDTLLLKYSPSLGTHLFIILATLKAVLGLLRWVSSRAVIKITANAVHQKGGPGETWGCFLIHLVHQLDLLPQVKVTMKGEHFELIQDVRAITAGQLKTLEREFQDCFRMDKYFCHSHDFWSYVVYGRGLGDGVKSNRVKS